MSATLARTYGFGSGSHDVAGQRLDATIDADGTWLVTPAHPGVRPLTLDEIARMRAVRVPATR